MDATQIGIVATSLSVAKDIGKALIGIRDFNVVAERVAALNDQLLKAQEALLAHNTAMFQLQSENFEAREELRKLKEAVNERSCYALVDLGKGHLAYRLAIAAQSSAPDAAANVHAPHYVCQPCYDNGRKVVLQRNYYMGIAGGLDCPVCKNHVLE